jgi:hypothetical protein
LRSGNKKKVWIYPLVKEEEQKLSPMYKELEEAGYIIDTITSL